MWVGTGWCATDGVEDTHRVRQSAPCAVLHWVYLNEKVNKENVFYPHAHTHTHIHGYLSLGTVGN